MAAWPSRAVYAPVNAQQAPIFVASERNPHLLRSSGEPPLQYGINTARALVGLKRPLCAPSWGPELHRVVRSPSGSGCQGDVPGAVRRRLELDGNRLVEQDPLDSEIVSLATAEATGCADHVARKLAQGRVEFVDREIVEAPRGCDAVLSIR